MLKWICVLLFLATPAFARDTGSAYDAMRTVGMRLGRGAVRHVISVIGVDGTPQPATWKIILDDPETRSGVREVEVSAGRIVSQRTVPIVGKPRSAILTARLNLDSTGAYAVANHTAENSHTVFDRVSYTLRNDSRGNPIWIVAFEDQSARPVGTVHINANGGSVTRVEGMFRGTNMLQVESDRDVPQPEDASGGDGDEFIVKRKLKQMFRRAKSESEEMFGRVRRSFEDFFYR